MSTEPRSRATTSATGAGFGAGRDNLMEKHRAARARRDAAALGSDEFRAAAEEIARIEIEIARREEPPVV